MRALLPVPVALAALAAAAAPALAHGGTYRPPPKPTGGIPTDSEILHPRVPVATPTEPQGMTPWERWWTANQDRYLHLRSRLRERDGTRTRASDDDTTGPGKDGQPAGPTARQFLEKEVLPVVTAALADEDAEVRSAAAVSLGKMGFPRSLMDLTRSLRDPDRDVRESALLALGMLGDSLAVEPLVEVLADPKSPERERSFAALGLGMIGGPEAAEALMQWLSPAGDARWVGGLKRRAETVCCVLGSLGLTGHAPAMPLLKGIALEGKMPYGGEAHATFRSFALVALGRLGDRSLLPRWAVKVVPPVRPGPGGMPAIQVEPFKPGALLALLSEDEPAVRQGAAIAMGMVAGPADELALTALARVAQRDRDLNARCLAIMALGRVGGPSAIGFLRTLLGIAPKTDLPFVALALGISGDRDSAVELHKRLWEEKDHGVKGAFTTALGLLKYTDAAADVRLLAFGKGNRDSRAHAMLALGLMGDKGGVEALLEVVSTEWDPVLKNAAGTALGLLQDRDALSRVTAVAEGASSILVRGHACRILGIIGNRDSGRILCRFARDPKETGYLRMFAITGLGILGERADVPILSSVGFDLDPEARNDALDTLAGLM